MLFKDITLSKSTLPAYSIPDCGDVVIPGFVTGPDGELCRIVSIGERTFSNTAIQSVVLPPTVKSIEDSAFAGCRSLCYIELPGVKNIGEYAFKDCFNLAPFIVPVHANVAENAFTGMQWIYSREVTGAPWGAENLIRIPDTTEDLILPPGADMDYMYFAGSTVFIPAYSEENGKCYKVTGMYAGAFRAACSTPIELVLPPTLVGIGEGAFGECTCNKIYIPSVVDEIETNAFRGVPEIVYYGHAEFDEKWDPNWCAYKRNGILTDFDDETRESIEEHQRFIDTRW